MNGVDPRVDWYEFALSGPAGRRERILVDVAGPFLRESVTVGVIMRGLVVRELVGEDRLIVQVQMPPGRPDAERELADRVRRCAGGGVGVVAGPAQVVPLAGPVFRGPALGPVTRGFLAEVTPTLLDLADTAAGAAGAVDTAERLSGALDLMAGHLPAVGTSAAPGAAAVAAGLGGAPLSFLSFRSHAEAFFVTSRDPAGARRAMDRRYGAVRASVEERLAGIFAQASGQGPVVSPAAAAWHAAVRAARPAVVEQFRAGGIDAETAYAEEHLKDPKEFAASAFHSTAGSSADLQRFLRSDPEFLAVRLLTSLMYLSLHTLGVSLLERYFLCHAASRACESLYDVDALTLLAGLARAET